MSALFAGLVNEPLEFPQRGQGDAQRNRQLAKCMAEIDAEPLSGRGGDAASDLRAARAQLRR